jgi:hypothetical protein
MYGGSVKQISNALARAPGPGSSRSNKLAPLAIFMNIKIKELLNIN